jgi:hypothetical protein
VPTLPDLVDQTTVLTYLADSAYPPVALQKLPQLITAASASVRRYCQRDFSLLTYDELYTASPPSRRLVLNQFPVSSVDTVATNPTGVLTASNGSASVVRPKASLASAGVVLTWYQTGAPQTATVSLTTNMTLAGLAAAVTAVGSGWTGTADPGYSAWPAALLRAPQGAFPAGATDGPQFTLHVSDLQFGLADVNGTLDLADDPSDATDSMRFGPFFSSEVQDVASFGGTNGVRVVYTAGFDPVPADVVTAVCETIKAHLDRARTDAALQSESDGVLSWTRVPDALVIPRGVCVILEPLVNHRA